MILRRRFVLPLLLVMLWAGCRNCSVLELRMNDRGITESLRPLPVPFSMEHWRTGIRRIRFLKVGHDTLPKLILLHGSPSSLSAWRPVYTDTRFLDRFQIIAIDRPGYGYSDFGQVITSLQDQVGILRPLIDSLSRSGPSILLGSSYGGPVAAQLAMDLPDRFSQLVLMSAALEPGAEKTYWISHPMTAPLIRYLFPPTFVMSSEEKLSHSRELETLRNWDRIRCKTLIIHGNKDGLVYYSNALYAKQKLVNARTITTVTMEGKGHSVIFSEPEYIRKLFLQHLSYSMP